jgi:hypothetical protein
MPRPSPTVASFAMRLGPDATISERFGYLEALALILPDVEQHTFSRTLRVLRLDELEKLEAVARDHVSRGFTGDELRRRTMSDPRTRRILAEARASLPPIAQGFIDHDQDNC